MTDGKAIFGTVVKIIDPDTVVINRGSDHGVSKGARYLLYGIGEEIVDPDTHESLGKLEAVRGTGVVKHVQQKMSTITSDMTRRTSGSVKIIDRTGSLGLFAFGKERVEEEGQLVTVSFNSVKIGDKAKSI